MGDKMDDVIVQRRRDWPTVLRAAGLLAHAPEELESNTAWPVMQMVMKEITYDDGD